MKIFQTLSFLAALVVGQIAAEEAVAKQLYHVTVPKVVFDLALKEYGAELDVWDASLVESDKIKADIYATEESINKFRGGKTELREASPLVKIEQDVVDMPMLIKETAAAKATCSSRTSRHLQAINATNYVNNAFFDCWRTSDEVYSFLDTLVKENSLVFSKIANVSTTYEGRTIPGYKLSTGGSGKKAIYVQGLIHAREWHAGSTTFYTIAALLDGLNNNDSTLKPLVTQYDWYFVPIVNLDGFIYTHSSSGDRLWRKNRRKINTRTYGVDLNRNFGPQKYFGLGGESPSAQTYPGSAPLSEPETAGIYKFIKTLPLAGALDVHAYSGLVLRPFGNQRAQVPAPWGTKLKTLGDNVKKAIQVNNTYTYTSQTAAELYLSYGSFMDSIFLEFNNTATLSFEMEGNNFVVSESVIRPGGKHVFQGIVQFARELTAYYS
ncbi:hypothetical protein Poli38472_013014 [Pythium oligandrum]|uniref:Peptidase M14 domain-containing protein n=1 Tax=Pythium oligandrum TaxID=41045 RepID=A0A8K1CLB2_PYTOL|nr:hypothetical protein Poli38472_013014 [Pythium oligandrum]|eukprot:TMW64392.1 hypothetical protein Poli38472_013014 [Pythium oligandrum]